RVAPLEQGMGDRARGFAKVRDQKPEIRAALDRQKKLTDQIAADLKAALSEFKTRHYRAASATSAAALVATP
ncbi:MAG: hypothetical protein ACXWNX_06195, partial [Isosphaeraceae bacterium]